MSSYKGQLNKKTFNDPQGLRLRRDPDGTLVLDGTQEVIAYIQWGHQKVSKRCVFADASDYEMVVNAMNREVQILIENDIDGGWYVDL